MKKVVYSVSRNNRFGSNKLTGLGFITESDLVIACMSKKGNAYIRVFEDCVKNCHAVSGRDGEFKGAYYEIREIEFEKKTSSGESTDMKRERSKLSIPSGISWLTKEACNEQILSQRISAFRR